MVSGERPQEQQSPDGRVKTKRPNSFWSPFTAWWRKHYAETSKRPTVEQAWQWYKANAASTWSPEEMPTFEELKKISAGTRTIEKVKTYFRGYRQAKAKERAIDRYGAAALSQAQPAGAQRGVGTPGPQPDAAALSGSAAASAGGTGPRSRRDAFGSADGNDRNGGAGASALAGAAEKYGSSKAMAASVEHRIDAAAAAAAIAAAASLAMGSLGWNGDVVGAGGGLPSAVSTKHALPFPVTQLAAAAGAPSAAAGGSGAGGGGSAAATAGTAPGCAPHVVLDGCHPDWLVVLTTDDRFFQPCPNCSRHHPGSREGLVMYLDLSDPHSPGVCSHCQAERVKAGHRLLRVRRNTYHDVVQVDDVAAMLDLEGIQVYRYTTPKMVVFLRSRPHTRHASAWMPFRCEVDGRHLMDSTARFCSLRCKMEREPGKIFRNPDSAAAAAVMAYVATTRGWRPGDGGGPPAAAAVGALAPGASVDAGVGACPSAPCALGAPELAGRDGGDDADPAPAAGDVRVKRRRKEVRHSAGDGANTDVEHGPTSFDGSDGSGGDDGLEAVPGPGLARHRTADPSVAVPVRVDERRLTREAQLWPALHRPLPVPLYGDVELAAAAAAATAADAAVGSDAAAIADAAALRPGPSRGTATSNSSGARDGYGSDGYVGVVDGQRQMRRKRDAAELDTAGLEGYDPRAASAAGLMLQAWAAASLRGGMQAWQPGLTRWQPVPPPRAAASDGGGGADGADGSDIGTDCDDLLAGAELLHGMALGRQAATAAAPASMLAGASLLHEMPSSATPEQQRPSPSQRSDEGGAGVHAVQQTGGRPRRQRPGTGGAATSFAAAAAAAAAGKGENKDEDEEEEEEAAARKVGEEQERKLAPRPRGRFRGGDDDGGDDDDDDLRNPASRRRQGRTAGGRGAGGRRNPKLGEQRLPGRAEQVLDATEEEDEEEAAAAAAAGPPHRVRKGRGKPRSGGDFGDFGDYGSLAGYGSLGGYGGLSGLGGLGAYGAYAAYSGLGAYGGLAGLSAYGGYGGLGAYGGYGGLVGLGGYGGLGGLNLLAHLQPPLPGLETAPLSGWGALMRAQTPRGPGDRMAAYAAAAAMSPAVAMAPRRRGSKGSGPLRRRRQAAAEAVEDEAAADEAAEGAEGGSPGRAHSTGSDRSLDGGDTGFTGGRAQHLQ